MNESKKNQGKNIDVKPFQLRAAHNKVKSEQNLNNHMLNAKETKNQERK